MDTSIEIDDGLIDSVSDMAVKLDVFEGPLDLLLFLIRKNEIDIYDNLFLSIIASDDTAPPNEQTGDYFTFSVMQIRLPWILNEPFPDSVASEVQSVFSKFLGFFKKKK